MNRIRFSSTLLVLALVLVSVLIGGTRSAPTLAAPGRPTLTNATALVSEPGMISVTGEAFTPGGEVYIALYDTWGAALHETRWISASQPIYGPNGSQDPARGFISGGNLSESLSGLCGQSVMARAYDQGTGAWSNWLDLTQVAAASAIYGPNGSADPARGYHPVC